MNDPVLTNEEITAIFEGMEGGPAGWLKTFGYQQFAKQVEKKILERLKPFGLQEQLSFRQDAERYRFLRDGPGYASPWTPNGFVWVVRYNHQAGALPFMESAGKGLMLDEAIDSAMVIK